MDVAALVIADLVVTEGSIRGAARRAGRPVGTVAGALARVEAALAVDLVDRSGGRSTATLSAQARSGALARLRSLAEALTDPSGAADPTMAAARLSVGVDALGRFAETVRLGSIRAAARLAGVGQPQLSRQISRLEAELGRPLLERTEGGSRPTADGRRVAVLGAELVDLWTELAAGAPRDFRRAERTVRFGTVVPLGHESRLARLVADVVARWPARRPGRHLAVKSGIASDLVADLKAGVLDAALIDADPGPLGLVGRRVARSRLALAGPPGLAAADPAAILRRGPVAVPSRRSGLRQRVDALLGTEPVLPDRFVEVDSIPVIVDLVMRHGFVSVLPLDSAAALGAAVATIPLGAEHDLALWLAVAPGRDGDGSLDDLVALIGPPPG